jgi:hypothetical protein
MGTSSSVMRCSSVQCSAVQCSGVEWSGVECSAVQYTIELHCKGYTARPFYANN